ncbi:hypothetical protein DIZ81_05565 [Legionella taurinensis]|uniref:Right-handed parallel beta-helix repeat-containing protein n=1 Tax=Legionella taurinensis TaxID=70611 RepID=A0A3A5L569_9GAMM|nr:hypothetical protein [Legionella taurinensis]MDX1837381.1 hypothetical protein [Legionella taurinensis]PUT40732.1 hypothetical protein DB744_05565 [Legionella taurinensis]PUT44154.1 hypothetical protein DB746_03965 [Legionella taurinensis]PUT47455.1 hypothetical protein DB743_02135 [Legionella taurinensis]PUT48594.1 hypothetical protein DB745_03965 [Legionella taurinensis]
MFSLKPTFSKLVGLVLLTAGVSVQATTWYLKAGNTPGKGTAEAPFNSMEALGNLAEEGDTLIILPSNEVFKGKITLKPDQIIKGGGVIDCAGTPFVCKVNQAGARITNPDGDAIELAENTQIMGIEIIKPAGYAIYGKNVRNVKISHTRIVSANQAAKVQDEFLPPPELRGFMTFFLGKQYNNRNFPKAAIAFVGDSDYSLDAIEISHSLIEGENNGGTRGSGVSVLLAEKSSAGIAMENNMIKGNSTLEGVVPNYHAGIYVLAKDEAEGRLKINGLSISHLKRFNDGIDLIAFDDAKLYAQIQGYQFYGSPWQGQMSEGLETITAYGQGKFAPLAKMTATEHHAQIVLRVQDSVITGSGGPGIVMCNSLGNAPKNIIDLGQGPAAETGTFIDSPSSGGNEIHNNSSASGNGVEVVVINGSVYARNNWWGEHGAIKGKSDDLTLDPKLARLCGVNLNAEFCQKGEVSQLYTEPALKKGGVKSH